MKVLTVTTLLIKRSTGQIMLLIYYQIVLLNWNKCDSLTGQHQRFRVFVIFYFQVLYITCICPLKLIPKRRKICYILEFLKMKVKQKFEEIFIMANFWKWQRVCLYQNFCSTFKTHNNISKDFFICPPSIYCTTFFYLFCWIKAFLWYFLFFSTTLPLSFVYKLL